MARRIGMFYGKETKELLTSAHFIPKIELQTRSGQNFHELLGQQPELYGGSLVLQCDAFVFSEMPVFESWLQYSHPISIVANLDGIIERVIVYGQGLNPPMGKLFLGQSLRLWFPAFNFKRNYYVVPDYPDWMRKGFSHIEIPREVDV